MANPTETVIIIKNESNFNFQLEVPYFHYIRPQMLYSQREYSVSLPFSQAGITLVQLKPPVNQGRIRNFTLDINGHILSADPTLTILRIGDGLTGVAQGEVWSNNAQPPPIGIRIN